MNTVAAVFADFDAAFLGGPSQLTADIGGRTVVQRTLERLSRVPEARRVDDFLRHDLHPAAQVAESAAKLVLADTGTTEMLQRTSEHLARLGPVLRDLHETVGDGPHAHAPARRGNRAAGGRAARR